MTKIYFNKEKIDNQVIFYVKKGINFLNNTKQIKVNIPYDFYYTNGTRRCLENINLLTKELIQLNNWLSSSNNELKQTMDSIDASLDNLTIIDLNERKNIIL